MEIPPAFSCVGPVPKCIIIVFILYACVPKGNHVVFFDWMPADTDPCGTHQHGERAGKYHPEND